MIYRTGLYFFLDFWTVSGWVYHNFSVTDLVYGSIHRLQIRVGSVQPGTVSVQNRFVFGLAHFESDSCCIDT